MTIPARRHSLFRRMVVALLCVSIATPALAWKPKTHVYLADLAMRDAIDDGMVTIYQTDYATGRVVGTLGSFEANPAIVAALRANPAQYRAGVVGPDAYPDIMTGQQVIHPGTNHSILGRPDRAQPASAEGSDAWLTHLWRLAYGPRDPNAERLRTALNSTILGEVAPPSDTPQIRAFVAGYLTHAAGDMFMHTFINHYTGGDFAIQPDPRNAIKHVVLEGYVGRRTPDIHAETSIEGVEGFIYRNMVRAYPGSILQERLLQGAGKKTSVPAIFSSLRNGLQRQVDIYDRERLQRSGPARVAYAAANGPAAEYKRAWIDDIDRGLQAWPAFSHQLSLALVYNPAGDGADIGRAKELASAFMGDHLLSMAGAPDAVIATAQFIGSVIDAILPTFLSEALAALKREFLDWLIREATGMSIDELQAYLSHPETQFDRVMNSPGGGYGGRTETLVTLADFNRSVLGIDDPGARDLSRKFQVDTFAPAFNTVQMTKLLFLSEKGMRDLLAALAAKGLTVPEMPTAPGAYESAMLGFLTSMDGDNRWQGLAAGSTDTHGRAFFLARGAADAWRNLFMRQIGERADWPATSAPAEDPLAAPNDAGFETIERWGARVDAISYDGDAGRTVTVSMTFRNDSRANQSFSDRIAKPVRVLLNVDRNSRVPMVRMDYVHPDGSDLPQWHYSAHSPIPPQGRVSVRFVFDVGDSIRQRLTHSISVFEQRSRSPLTPTQMVDGPTRDFPVERLNLDGSTGEKARPVLPAAVNDADRLHQYAGRFRTNRGTILPLAVVGDELVGEAMTIDRPSPREMVKLKLYADGTLRGSMRDPVGRNLAAWFDLVVRFDADAGSFTAEGTASHAAGEPPITYTGQRERSDAASSPQPGPPIRIGDYDVAFQSLQKGVDGDWETTWSLTNRSDAATTVQLNDLSATLRDAGGQAQEGAGPYHYADEPGRRVRRSGFEIAPGEETRIRLWHSGSRNLVPTAYSFRVRGEHGEGTLQSLPAGFVEAGYFALRFDGVSTTPAHTAVTLTALNYRGGRQGLQYNTNRFVVVGSNGTEYRTDGNTYGTSAADRLVNTVWLEDEEQAPLTYVFAPMPPGVTPSRLVVRDGTRDVTSIDLTAAPAAREQATAETAEPAAGADAGSPVTLGTFEAALVALHRAADGDWESVVSFTNISQVPARLNINEMVVALYGASGDVRHANGNFYVADDPNRRAAPSGQQLGVGETLRFRFWHPQSAGITPTRYRLRERGKEPQTGAIPAAMLPAP